MLSLLIQIVLFVAYSAIFVDCANCDFTKIPFPGLKRETTLLYSHGESFIPRCAKGYTETKPGGKLVCNNGTWNGHFPPCVIANCGEAPPSIKHGKAINSTKATSIVGYECDELYFLEKESSVQCALGEWKGSLPICRDSRCRFKDLKLREGIMPANDSITLSGEHLKVRCDEGYKHTGVTPLCIRGAWTEFGTSPCKQRECVVAEIRNGELMEAKERNVFRWRKFRRESKTIYKTVKKGVTKQPSHKLQLICDPKYSFEGSSLINITVTCEKGMWIPKPVCLKMKG